MEIYKLSAFDKHCKAHSLLFGKRKKMLFFILRTIIVFIP